MRMRRALMSNDPILDDVADFKRRQQTGEVKAPTPEEDATWSRSTRERLDALTKKRQDLLKK